MNLLILGADSPVGQALADLLTREGLAHAGLPARGFLSLREDELLKTLSRCEPTQVLYTAAFTEILAAESNPAAAARCERVNVLGVQAAALACQRLQVPLLLHSSSLVFDGRKAQPYTEDDETNPESRYGQSKLAGERALSEILPTHLILRSDWVFDDLTPGYFTDLLKRLRQGKGRLEVPSLRFCPTPAADVARVLLAMARQVDCAAEAWGLYHYCALQPVAQDSFVENLLQEVAKYDAAIAALLPRLELVKTAVEKPWIANSALSAQKLFETFGIKQRSRAGALSALLQRLCHYVPAPPPPPEPAPAAAPEPPPVPKRRPRLKPRSGSATPAKKGAKRKP